MAQAQEPSPSDTPTPAATAEQKQAESVAETPVSAPLPAPSVTPMPTPPPNAVPLGPEPGVPQPELPCKIDEVRWIGLTRTHQYVVERELPWRPGDIVSAEDYKLGLDRLGNLTGFTEVKGWLETREGKNIAVFRVDERWTIKPVLSGAFGGNSFWVILGVSERNLLGHNLFAEVLYQNFNGVHGGRLYFENPRMFNTFTDFVAVAESMMRTRPFNVVQRTKGRVGAYKLMFKDMLQFGGAGEVFSDNFYPSQPAGVMEFTTPVFGWFIEPQIRYGRIWRTRNLLEGRTVELKPQLGYVAQGVPKYFAQAVLEAVSFWKLVERINIVGRIRAGTTTSVPHQMIFFLGGTDYVRGYADNTFQLDHFALFNFDFRVVTLDKNWLAILPYVFTDGIVGTGTVQGFRAGLSVGAGLLFTIPWIAASELRVDVSLPIQQPLGPALGFSTVYFY